MQNGIGFSDKDLSAFSWIDFLKPGTDVVKFLSFPLVKFFNLPFWSGFPHLQSAQFCRRADSLPIYCIAGSNVKLHVLVLVLMLLPNLHFWTSLIGKGSADPDTAHRLLR